MFRSFVLFEIKALYKKKFQCKNPDLFWYFEEELQLVKQQGERWLEKQHCLLCVEINALCWKKMCFHLGSNKPVWAGQECA